MPEKTGSRLLHIDGPPPFLRFVEKYCSSKGIAVEYTVSAAQVFHYALFKRYKLILLGAHAPRIDAIRTLKGLVRAKIATQVFFLSDSPEKDRKWVGYFPNLMGVI